jgi:hypothetical protein
MQLHHGDWICFDCDFIWMAEGKIYPDTFDEWVELMQPDLPRDLARRDGKYVQRKLKLIGGGVGSFCGSIKHYRRVRHLRTRAGVMVDA